MAGNWSEKEERKGQLMTENTHRSDRNPTEPEQTADLPVASTNHNNSDLFIWALELVGGRNGYVDVEDVYYKCFELAPKRFGWRTRPDLPNLTRLNVARQDAVKRQNRLGIVMIDALEVDVTEGKPVPAYKWRLTAAGAEWCDIYAKRLTDLYGGGTVPASPKQLESRRVRELRDSALFSQWESGDAFAPSRVEMADLLECSPASERKVFDLRLDQAQEAAQRVGDSAVLSFVGDLRSILEKPNAAN